MGAGRGGGEGGGGGRGNADAGAAARAARPTLSAARTEYVHSSLPAPQLEQRTVGGLLWHESFLPVLEWPTSYLLRDGAPRAAMRHSW